MRFEFKSPIDEISLDAFLTFKDLFYVMTSYWLCNDFENLVIRYVVSFAITNFKI